MEKPDSLRLPIRLSGPARAVCYGIAAIVFVTGIVISIRLSPIDFRAVRILPLLLLALILTPLQVALNAWEFIVSSRMQSARFTFPESLRVTVTGSIANYLPIPGAMMTKVAALKLRGVAIAKGTIYTLFSFLVLAGAAFLYAGIWILYMEERTIAVVHFVIACAICAAALIFLRHQRIAGREALNLLANRLCGVALDGLRLYVALLALGSAGLFAQAAALTTSGVLGLAVPIVPSGLGVRELVSSLIAPIVGASGPSVFLAASLIRIVDLAVLAAISPVLYSAERK